MHRWDTPDESRAAWDWIHAELTDDDTVGSLVPGRYERYVSVPNSRDPEDAGCSLVQEHAGAHTGGRDQLDRLLAVLAAGDEPLHCAIWHGFGGMFREADGTVQGYAMFLLWGADDPPSEAEARRERELREAAYAAARPPRPEADHLVRPIRGYYTWGTTVSGLRADARLLGGYSPTMVFPADRRWFWHSEIDARRTDIGGPADLLEPLTAAPWGGFDLERSRSLGEIPGRGA